MPYTDHFLSVVELADQAAAEIAGEPDDEFEDDIIAGLFKLDGPAKRRLRDYLKSLPRGEIRMLIVLMYCGRERTRNTVVARNVIDDPTNVLVGQMLSKAPYRLRDYWRAGIGLVRFEDPRRFDEVSC